MLWFSYVTYVTFIVHFRCNCGFEIIYTIQRNSFTKIPAIRERAIESEIDRRPRAKFCVLWCARIASARANTCAKSRLFTTESEVFWISDHFFVGSLFTVFFLLLYRRHIYHFFTYVVPTFFCTVQKVYSAAKETFFFQEKTSHPIHLFILEWNKKISFSVHYQFLYILVYI